MTLVGHTLTGIALRVLCKPVHTSTNAKSEIVYLVTFALLSNFPDLPFKNWGHDKYAISHSLFVNLFIILTIIIVLLFLKDIRGRIGGWEVIFGGAIAWLSHLLLDSFYNHGAGIAIFWPFAQTRLALPIPWFAMLQKSFPNFTWQAIQVYIIEFASFFPLLLLALGFKRTNIGQRLFKNTSSGGSDDRAEFNG